MTTLGSESSPIDRLDVDTALDHWANGKGGDVYVDATSHMISGGGSVFDLQSFSNGLLSTAKFSSNGASYHLESNVAKAGESGDPIISATYNYYDYEGWIATDPHEIPNSVVWGKTSATVNATVKVIEKPVTLVNGQVTTTTAVLEIHGHILPTQEQFYFTVNSMGIGELGKIPGRFMIGPGMPYDIKFVGAGAPVDGTYLISKTTTTWARGITSVDSVTLLNLPGVGQVERFPDLPFQYARQIVIDAYAAEQQGIADERAEAIHVAWALSAGGWLGVGNDPRYNHTKCFNPFPFPTPTEAQTTRLRALGEELDAHRKAQQAAHPKLTLTAMYNVLEKLRAGQRIEGRDREIYDQGLVGILRDIHDRIDTEVAAAYGWPADLPDAEILQRLVDLNHTRAAEEARGLVRWLRPDYQNPAGRAVAAKGETAAMDLGPTEATDKTPWPKTLPEQFAAVRSILQEMGEASPDQIARRFLRLRQTSVQPLLESLTLLGQARLVEGGRFAA